MARSLYMNGSILPEEEAQISPMDRGLLYGDGLFETMRAYNGTVHLLRRHLERLKTSAEELRIPIPDNESLRSAIYSVMEANRLLDARIRLTVTRGVGGLPTNTEGCSGPTVIVTIKEITPSSGISSGEPVIILKQPFDPPYTSRRLKTLNYLQTVYAGFELQEAGVREGVMLTREGMVAEGTVSNFFCVRDRILCTPPINAGVLPGIIRERVMELAGTMEVEVREELFDAEFLRGAEECFYTNSIREIVPVISVDEQVVGTGTAGHVTTALYEAYHTELPDEEL